MIYTCINYPIPRLVLLFCLQRFSSFFESSVKAVTKLVNVVRKMSMFKHTVRNISYSS